MFKIFILFCIIKICQVYAGMITELYSAKVANYGNVSYGNVTVTYKKKGDFSSYRADIDILYKRELASLGIRFKVLKFPTVGNWTDGSVFADVNVELCNDNGKNTRRKSDFYADALRQMFVMYVNRTVDCPMKKGIYSIRGVTLNEMKIPMLQYFLGDNDYQLVYMLQTKVKRKLFVFQIHTYIGGTRRT